MVLHNLLLSFNDPWIPEEGLIGENLTGEAHEVCPSGRLQDGDQDNGHAGDSYRNWVFKVT